MSEIKYVEIQTIPAPFAKVIRDYPITERENVLLALSQKKSLWIPKLTRQQPVLSI